MRKSGIPQGNESLGGPVPDSWSSFSIDSGPPTWKHRPTDLCHHVQYDDEAAHY